VHRAAHAAVDARRRHEPLAASQQLEHLSAGRVCEGGEDVRNVTFM
jgi:hypothetical protein